jgi:hypothetical protein
MIGNLLKLSGYVLLAREAADFFINSQHRRQQEQNREHVFSSVSTSLVSLAVGVGIGVFFAPRAGKETREMILNATCDCIQCGIAEGKGQFSEILSKKKEEFGSTTDETSAQT